MSAARGKHTIPATPDRLARSVGWVSIVAGVAQIVAPRTVARLAGVPFPPAFTIACGVRELACGLGILLHRRPDLWLQARVAGDALDLAVMGGALLVPGVDRRRLALATAAVAGLAAVDVYLARELMRYAPPSGPRQVTTIISIDRPAEELYRFWRNFANLPRVMPHVDSVQMLDDTHSHWVALGPAGARVEWDAEVIDDEPGVRLAWRSVEGSQIYNAGSVQFVPADGGASTDVRVDLLYEPPGGSLGALVASAFGRNPGRTVRADLRTFKALMEAGTAAPAGAR